MKLNEYRFYLEVKYRDVVDRYPFPIEWFIARDCITNRSDEDTISIFDRGTHKTVYQILPINFYQSDVIADEEARTMRYIILELNRGAEPGDAIRAAQPRKFGASIGERIRFKNENK